MTEKPSTQFERQIERIHRLLEEEPSNVTWNDKIPDPDNPDQLRQIDITIERDGTIIHVECRIHKAPQDVKWIEELIGRKLSLRVDAIIAVSSSGFTAGALRKAAQFNIHTRTLQALTDEEVRLWGNMARPELVFYEFMENKLLFTCSSLLSWPITITSEDGKSVEWCALFEQLMKRCDDDPDLDVISKAFTGEIFASLLINGSRPLKMELSGTVRRVRQPVVFDTVHRYAPPKDSDADLTRVQKYDGDVLEVLQSSDDVAIRSDTTGLAVPPNCFFHTLFFDFQRPVNLKWFELAGLYSLVASDVKIEISVICAPLE